MHPPILFLSVFCYFHLPRFIQTSAWQLFQCLEFRRNSSFMSAIAKAPLQYFFKRRISDQALSQTIGLPANAFSVKPCKISWMAVSNSAID
jgi:hypothetical protein